MVDTFYLMHHYIAILSNINPKLNDCCINTCCASLAAMQNTINAHFVLKTTRNSMATLGHSMNTSQLLGCRGLAVVGLYAVD